MLLPRKEINEYVLSYERTKNPIIRGCIIAHVYCTAVSIINKKKHYWRLHDNCVYRCPEDLAHSVVQEIIIMLDHDPKKKLYMAKCIPVYIGGVVFGIIKNKLRESSLISDNVDKVDDIELYTRPKYKNFIPNEEKKHMFWVLKRLKYYLPPFYLNCLAGDCNREKVIKDIITEVRKSPYAKIKNKLKMIHKLSRKHCIPPLHYDVLSFLMYFYEHDIRLYLQKHYFGRN